MKLPRVHVEQAVFPETCPNPPKPCRGSRAMFGLWHPTQDSHSTELSLHFYWVQCRVSGMAVQFN